MKNDIPSTEGGAMTVDHSSPFPHPPIPLIPLAENPVLDACLMPSKHTASRKNSKTVQSKSEVC
jgi:hypothetical protein